MYVFYLWVSVCSAMAFASMCGDVTHSSRLIPGDISEVFTDTSMMCSALCRYVSSCRSSSWSSITDLCQLSRETSPTSPGSFSASPQHLYNDVLSQPCTVRDSHPCSNRPCGYNEVCIAVQRGTDYKCFDVETLPGVLVNAASEEPTATTTITTAKLSESTTITPGLTSTIPELTTGTIGTTKTTPQETSIFTTTTTTSTTFTTTTTSPTTTTTTSVPITTSTSTTTTTSPTTTPTTTKTTTTTTTATTTTHSTTATSLTTTTTTSPTTTTSTTTTPTRAANPIKAPLSSSCTGFEKYIDKTTGFSSLPDEMQFGKTATQCEDACAADPVCLMYTHTVNSCALFHFTVDPAEMTNWNGVTSGIKCSGLWTP